MQITDASYIQKINATPYKGNALSPMGKAEPSQEKSFMHELAKSIDPSSMSRNDARAIGDALSEAKGDFELASSFYTQSMVLVQENGSFRNATGSDDIMNEKFNMFDSLEKQIEFHKSRNLPTESLEEMGHFLQKLQVARTTEKIDKYA